MVDSNLTLSVITFNVNGLNIPIKRQRLSGRSKNKTQLCIVQYPCFKYNADKKLWDGERYTIVTVIKRK